MTRFTKDTLVITRAGTESWIHYHAAGEPGKFVARFKYGSKSSAGDYKKFLIANFTVEEFFELQEAGQKDPKHGGAYKVAEERGFLLRHIREWLKEGGYEVSQAGYKLYLADGLRKDALKYAASHEDPKVRASWAEWLEQNPPISPRAKAFMEIYNKLPSIEQIGAMQ